MYGTVQDYFGFSPSAPSLNYVAPMGANSGTSTTTANAPSAPASTQPNYMVGNMAIPAWVIGITLALVAVRVLYHMGAVVD